MLKRFAYHGVTVRDLDRSVAFYRDVLDMKVEKTCEVAGGYVEKATGFPGAYTRVAELRYKDTFGDHLLKLIQYLVPEGRKRFETRLCDVGASHIDICTDQVQQLYDRLRAKGAKFISPPVHPFPERPERTFTYMLDPDGIVIELHLDTPHHAHVVSDSDRAVAFYRDILGMKLKCIHDIRGQGIAEGTGFPGAHKSSAHLVLDTDEFVELLHYMHPEGKKQPEIRLCDVGCSYVAFDVDDVQQSYQELQAKGAKLVSRPVHLRAEGPEVRMVYVLDPDDYVVELRSGSTLR